MRHRDYARLCRALEMVMATGDPYLHPAGSFKQSDDFPAAYHNNL
jgi:hypothetical protein